MSDVKLAKLLTLYRPNVGTGNFQADVAWRSANDMLVRVAVVLGVASEERIRAQFRRLDNEASDRSEAFLAKFNAEQDAKAKER